MKHLVIVCLTVFLFSCQLTSIRGVYPDDPIEIESDHGYLFLPIFQNRIIREIVVYGEINFYLDYRHLSRDGNAILLKIPAGDYHFGSIKLYSNIGDFSKLSSTNIFDDEQYRFTVESGKVSYLGHLYINNNAHTFSGQVGVNLVDSSHKAIKYLKVAYPGLLDLYTFSYVGKSEMKEEDLNTSE